MCHWKVEKEGKRVLEKYGIYGHVIQVVRDRNAGYEDFQIFDFSRLIKSS